MRRMCTFPKNICPKVNLIVQLEFELTYYDVSVQIISHFITRTNHSGISQFLFWSQVPPAQSAGAVKYSDCISAEDLSH